MRRRATRAPVLLVLASMLASLITVISPVTASATESIPELQWSPVQAEASRYPLTTSPKGDVTIGCGTVVSSYPQDVVTWGSAGSEVRHINRTPQVDGKENCIDRPVVDRNSDLYGGLTNGYLYAYSGNTLKWKYQTGCTYNPPWPIIGADGNIYFINNNGRLIGLTPKVEPDTTQPKKMLDIAISNSRCNDSLLAFKGGLIHINYNRKATYYTYTGTQLGSPPTDAGYYPGHTPINAAGRMFYTTYSGSGNNVGVKLNAYDPVPGKISWTAQESTFGFGITDVVRIYATPDGGAVVHVKRAKVVAGAPTSEKIWALIKVNVFGIKAWSIDLPNTDASGNPVQSQSDINVDVTGRLVLLRHWIKQLNSYPWQVPFITVDTLDVNTGEALSSPKIMSGNIDSSQGEVYGYQAHDRQVIGLNTVYVSAERCTTYCYGDGKTKIYPIKVPGLGLDYPRGAVLSRVPRPATAYIAGGDSFSAGESITPFDTATNLPGINTCHRSSSAYPRLIAGTSTKIPSLGSSGFRACSGAVSEYVWDVPQWNEGIQLDLWPDTTTKLVTLTIGGNDIGFGELAKACILEFASCGIGSTAHTNSLNKINNELAGKLTATYRKILQYAPNAKVFAIGYPQVMANKAPTAPLDSRCAYMYDPTDSPDHWKNIRAARDIVTKLNQKISSVVAAVRAEQPGNTRLHYISVDHATSPFVGHEVCGSLTSWFQNVDQAVINPDYVFHPNASGQQGYASLVAAAINAN